MNPVLLKPTSDRASQVVVMGRPVGHLDAAALPVAKADLLPVVLTALESCGPVSMSIVAEGAGSPAEPNLMADDLVNLGLAERPGDPGHPGRGHRAGWGVRRHVRDDGAPSRRPAQAGGRIRDQQVPGGPTACSSRPSTTSSDRIGVPCLGVLPHARPTDLDAEDSLALAGHRSRGRWASSDWDPDSDGRCGRVPPSPPLEFHRRRCRWPSNPGSGSGSSTDPSSLGDPDLVIIPGSKCTVADLDWLRASALDGAISPGRPPEAAPCSGSAPGTRCSGTRSSTRSSPVPVPSTDSGWIPMTTRFGEDKVTRQRRGTVDGCTVHGYEIRHGQPGPEATVNPWFELDDRYGREPEGVADPTAGMWGTSLHGLFEQDGFREAFLAGVARRRGKRFVPGGRRSAWPVTSRSTGWPTWSRSHADLAALVGLIGTGTSMNGPGSDARVGDVVTGTSDVRP